MKQLGFDEVVVQDAPQAERRCARCKVTLHPTLERGTKCWPCETGWCRSCLT